MSSSRSSTGVLYALEWWAKHLFKGRGIKGRRNLFVYYIQFYKHEEVCKVYNVYMNMDVVVSFFFHLSCLPSCPPVVPLLEHSYFWRLFVIAQPRWHCTWILCISMYDDILIDLHLGRRNHFLRIVCSIYICFTHSGGVEANIFKVSVEWWSVVN